MRRGRLIAISGCEPRRSPELPARFLRPPHSGLTLIELLIVMGILVMLVSAAIPVMSPSTSERRVREASRGLNTYLSGFQSRAALSNRPQGVLLKKLSQDTNDPEDNGVCVELLPVEQPAPYEGFSEASRVCVSRLSPNNALVLVQFVSPATVKHENLPAGWGSDLLPPGLFQPGDVIDIGGVDYRLLAGNNGNTPLDANGYFEPITGELVRIAAEPLDSGAPSLLFSYNDLGARLTDPAVSASAPYWTNPFPYEIRRQPVLTSAPPYQLPEGTAIDLRASGTDSLVFHKADDGDGDTGNVFLDWTDNRSPVILMFSPEGKISRLYASLDAPSNDQTNNVDAYASGPVISSVYLLVGQRDNIPAPIDATEADFTGYAGSDSDLEDQKAKFNWMNGESRWVVIGGQTGAVTTSLNAFVNPVAVAADPDLTTFSQWRDREIFLSRAQASQKAGEGGR